VHASPRAFYSPFLQIKRKCVKYKRAGNSSPKYLPSCMQNACMWPIVDCSKRTRGGAQEGAGTAGNNGEGAERMDTDQPEGACVCVCL
jgi:hypothetical protein